MITIEPKEENNETVDIFELEGETYSIPKKPRANVLLRYMREVREEGEEKASSRLLESMLGEEAYEALLNCDYLTVDDFQAIMLEVQQHVMGQVEESGKGDKSS